MNYIEKKYGEIGDAYYYIGQGTPPSETQKAYLDALPDMGYTLVSKPIKTIYDANTGESKQKANLDVEIVLDMFNTIENYDMAILISGDGDFERALSMLRSRGKKFVVMATDNFIAKELRAVAGRHYLNLKDIKADIAKE